MSQTITYGGVDIAGAITLAEGIAGMTSHADGTFGAGEALIDDPDGAFDFLSLQEFIHEESDCSQPRTFTGFLAVRRLERGSYRADAQRVHQFDILDLNYLLHLQPLRGSTAKRPIESGDDRMAWLLASVALDGIVFDHGFIGANVNMFDEADYTGEYADDVLRDLCVSSITEVGRIFFVYRDSATGDPSLFMDVPQATTYTSTLSISNDLSDLDATTLEPRTDAQLEASGEDIYCSVFFKYKTGTVYRHNDTTHATYFAGKGYHRQAVFETTRVGSLDTATRHADAFLANHAGDLDTITCTLDIPSSQLNLIEAGMRVNAKFTHFPGFDSFGYLRVSSRTVGLSPLQNDLYEMRLVLSNKTITPAGTGSGSTGDFPLPPPQTPSIVQKKIAQNAPTMDNPILEGDTLFVVQSTRSGSYWNGADNGYTMAFPVITKGDGDTLTSWIKVAGPSESTTLTMDVLTNTGTAWYELPGTWEVGTHVDETGTANPFDVTGASVHAGSIVIGASMYGSGGAFDSGASPHSAYSGSAGWTEDGEAYPSAGHPELWAGHQFPTADATISLQVTATNPTGPYEYGVAIFELTSTGFSTQPPSPGQLVPWETITMVGAVGTTTYPYADGSLQIKVDGVLISTASYTETDPAAGTFTLAWTPDADETVTATYLGR